MDGSFRRCAAVNAVKKKKLDARQKEVAASLPSGSVESVVFQESHMNKTGDRVFYKLPESIQFI